MIHILLLILGKCTKIQTLNIGKNGKMEIINTDAGYDIEYNDSKIASINVPTGDKKPNTIGFITDHFGSPEGHNCSNHGYFKISNIKINVKFNL